MSVPNISFLVCLEIDENVSWFEFDRVQIIRFGTKLGYFCCDNWVVIIMSR